jgi:uncharacterized membrane protein
MEQTNSQSQLSPLLRWLVPLAAFTIFVIWFSIAPPGLLGKADAVGYAICHRIDERSFHVFGRQLPLCARCTGEFYAAAITLLFLSLVSPKKSGMPGWQISVVLITFLAAFAIDGVNSYIYLLKQMSGGELIQIPNLYIPNNTLRLLTGSGMGIAIVSILFPAFNSTTWRTNDPAPALDWKKLGSIIGIILIIDLLILTEQAAILLPIAIISVLGVLSLLTIVFSMVWMMVMRQDNTFEKLTQLWMPVLAGTTLAFLMITVIDLLRFKLTGTWGGFPLG